MTTATDTRPTVRQLRTPAFRDVVSGPSRTRGPSPRFTEFRKAVERLLRARFPERAKCVQQVLADIRASHHPDRFVNMLAEEAADHGGPDGLDVAANILAQVPVPLERVIDSLFEEDSSRRKQDRKLGHFRYRVTDEVWSVLVDALARPSDKQVPTAAVLSTLRRLARSATDGMIEGLTTAALSLAERGGEDRRKALVFLKWLQTARAKRGPLPEIVRRCIEGAIADLEG